MGEPISAEYNATGTFQFLTFDPNRAGVHLQAKGGKKKKKKVPKWMIAACLIFHLGRYSLLIGQKILWNNFWPEMIISSNRQRGNKTGKNKGGERKRNWEFVHLYLLSRRNVMGLQVV